MTTLHIAPGDSAGGSLRHALREAGRDDDVLGFRDDLSCGPIALGNAAERAEWWGHWYDDPDIEAALSGFWDRVLSADAKLVVWFSRHCASEIAFLLAFADRLAERRFECIDVTGRQFLRTRQDGSTVLGRPIRSLGIMNSEVLTSLFDSERAASAEFKEGSRHIWQRLRVENAPFRIVTDAGLVSAPEDVFDRWLVERATSEWCAADSIIHDAIGYNDIIPSRISRSGTSCCVNVSARWSPQANSFATAIPGKPYISK